MTALLATVAATRSVYATLRRKPPGGSARWARTNHAGRTVDLYGGLAAATGTVLATAAAPGLPVRSRTAAALAVLAAGGCGAYDDLAGTPGERGFRAHMGALQEGRVTSGAVKLFGIGAAGLAAGALLKERPADRLLAGVVVAGTAHLVNLVDVKPGRAAKAVIAAGVPGMLRGGPAGALAGAPVGAAVAVLADDAGERTMLGDAGAHALGAAVGVSIVVANGRAGLCCMRRFWRGSRRPGTGSAMAKACGVLPVCVRSIPWVAARSDAGRQVGQVGHRCYGGRLRHSRP